MEGGPPPPIGPPPPLVVKVVGSARTEEDAEERKRKDREKLAKLLIGPPPEPKFEIIAEKSLHAHLITPYQYDGKEWAPCLFSEVKCFISFLFFSLSPFLKNPLVTIHNTNF